QNGESIAGVNVVLKGTYYGAATDLDGNFSIVGISPGSYDLQATAIGYTTILQTNVVIEDDNSVVELTLEMKPTVLAAGQEVVVIGEKPLLDVDETASVRSLSKDEIEGTVAEDVDDLLENQVGVVRENNQIHIRGGRADENLYIIDNLSVKDPISGEGLGIYLSVDAIQNLEVITGGFNAEYGEAMSGLVNVETREGGETFSGSFALKTDNLGGFPGNHQNTGNAEFSLGGPLPLQRIPGLGGIPGEIGFFINGYGYASDTYLPSSPTELVPRDAAYDDFALRQENNWSALGKLSYKPSPILKFTYSYGRSLRINQGYFDSIVEDRRYFPNDYMNILSKYNTITRDGIQQTFNLNHTLSNRTYYELTVGNFYNRVHSAVGRLHWTEYEEPVDTEPVVYEVLPNGEILVESGDGRWDDGTGDTYHDHSNDTWQIKYKLTSKILDKHQVRGGFEYEATDLQLFNIHDPWVAATEFGGDYDKYNASTFAGAFYLQDKIEFEGMIANIGLRLDYWAPGKYVEEAIADEDVITLSDAARQLFHDETTDMFGYAMKWHLSPRLGISHPVTDSDVLFFNYGHFSQRPKYSYVFAKLKSYSPSTYQLFGNPNLNPQTTVMYELGIKHRFTGDEVLELTAFYKDIFDYPTSFQVSSENPRLGNVSYYQYFNIDYARVRGLEARFRARQGRYLSGVVDFAYQIATGKSSSANAEIQAAANTRVQEKTLGEEFLSWDRPFRGSISMFLNVRKDDNPRWFGFEWPDLWGGSLRWEGSSGKRYTPAELVNEAGDVQDTGERYSELADWWNTLDGKLYKDLLLPAKSTLRIFVEVENIFNFQIPRQINPLTGRPFHEGDPYPGSWENPQGEVLIDPSRYRGPRQAFLGVNLRW
ncbi:TonB-dependent receptor, partial [bacterium]|nr:TonB-dependent receptor [bacterium]